MNNDNEAAGELDRVRRKILRIPAIVIAQSDGS